jgi:menaquinone-dependent protoporphyrinogen oxidase
MPRVLILYGTTDGHTAKIARALAGALAGEGCATDVIDAGQRTAGVTPAHYDGVIVAASVHIGSYQRPVARWVRLHAPLLNAMPSAFLSVCLAVMEKRPEARSEVSAIMERFLKACGWQPAVRKLVAGATPFTRYNWVKKWIMRRIAAKAGGDTDTRHDVEYTDWGDLKAFARDFAHRVGEGAPAPVETVPIPLPGY